MSRIPGIIFFGDDKIAKSTRDVSSAQENYVAGIIGAKVQPNSGATAFDKGDLIDEFSLFECKTSMTVKKSVSLKKEWFEKNEEESIARGRTNSILVFNFGEVRENFVSMKLSDFMPIYEAWKEQQLKEMEK